MTIEYQKTVEGASNTVKAAKHAITIFSAMDDLTVWEKQEVIAILNRLVEVDVNREMRKTPRKP